MKQAIFFAVATLVTAQSALADAGHLPRQKISQAKIERVVLGLGHEHLRYVLGGQVTVNHTFRRVDLTLDQGCRPGEACPKIVFRPIVLQLPIVQNFEDDCGSEHYIALTDDRPRDGSLRMVHVTDHTLRRCDDVQGAPTVVEFETETAGMSPQGIERGRSVFFASPMQSNFPVGL